MTRLFVLTFHGPERYTEDNKHPHESPPIMTIPLILLALGSIVAGWLMRSPVVDWLTPVLRESHVVKTPHLDELTVSLVTLLLVVLGAGGAWALFRRGTALEPQPAGAIVTAARNNLYGDALNEALFEKPGIFLTRALVFFDNKGIDGAVNGLAALVGGGSGRLRRAQTGYVRTYALSVLGGALIVLVALLAVTVT
jgi:NADH-quinone oxidoreductase subunit L